MYRLIVVLEKGQQQFRVSLVVFGELIQGFIVPYIEVNALLVVVLEILVEEAGLSDLDGAQVEVVLSDGDFLEVLAHLGLVLGAAVDECVEEKQAVLEELQEKVVIFGGGLQRGKIVPVVP